MLKVIREMERETGLVSKKALFDVLMLKYGTSKEENELKILRLIMSGVVYEPREGYLKIT